MLPRETASPPPGTAIAITRLPSAIIFSKTPKPLTPTHSATSTSSMAKRVSGLSDPKRSMASRQVTRGNGVGSSTPMDPLKVSARTPSHAA